MSLSVKNTLGGGKPNAPYAWAKYEYEVIPPIDAVNPTFKMSSSSYTVTITESTVDLTLIGDNWREFFDGFKYNSGDYPKFQNDSDLLRIYASSSTASRVTAFTATSPTTGTLTLRDSWSKSNTLCEFIGTKHIKDEESKVGSFIEYITDKSPTKYPNGEVHTDGYFYRYAPEGLYVWKKNEIGSELKALNESVSTLPFGFYNSSAVVLNGEIHILGGTVQPKYHYKWDGSSWTSVSTLPYDFYMGSAVVLNGEIHILGGDYNGTRHYKWDGTSWASVSTLPYDFYNGSAVVLNGEIHILGTGNNNNSYYTNHYKFNGISWTKVSTLPYVFYNSSAVVFNNEIHILGGGNKSSYYTNHYKWNGTSWTSVSTLPYNFYDGSAVVFNNEIHILGGSDNTAISTNHYKWNGSSWESVGALPYSFDDGSAVIYNNTIHILGSYNSNYQIAHYLVYGYVTVYTFLDYIVSDKETAYPDGGEKGGYWYERVVEGLDVNLADFDCTMYETGEIISTSNSSNLTVNHSLGIKPTYIILYNGTKTGSYVNDFVAVAASGSNTGSKGAYNVSNGNNARVDGYTGSANFTTKKVTLSTPSGLYQYFRSGATYKYLIIA